MNNKIIIGIVLVVVVVGGIILLNQGNNKPNRQQPVTKQQTTQQPQSGTEVNSVTIQNFAFSPAKLTIKQGTTVTWTNEDSAPHKIKSDSFNSGDLSKGDKFEFTFNTKGNFAYSCSIHPAMTGEIVVE